MDDLANISSPAIDDTRDWLTTYTAAFGQARMIEHAAKHITFLAGRCKKYRKSIEELQDDKDPDTNN